MNSRADEDAFAALGLQLAGAIEAALPGWVVRSVERVALASGRPLPGDLLTTAAAEGRSAAEEVGARLRALVVLDVDEQRVNPLAVVRAAVRYPTAVLAAAGVPPVVRDEFAERSFPDDVYDLTPATFADLDAGLGEPGLVWGAAKAHVHLRRHKRPT